MTWTVIPSRVVTYSRPHYLGPAESVRTHSVPLASVPCLAMRAKESEEGQKMRPEVLAGKWLSLLRDKWLVLITNFCPHRLLQAQIHRQKARTTHDVCKAAHGQDENQAAGEIHRQGGQRGCD